MAYTPLIDFVNVRLKIMKEKCQYSNEGGKIKLPLQSQDQNIRF